MGTTGINFQIMISCEGEGKNEEYKERGLRSDHNILFLLRKVLD